MEDEASRQLEAPADPSRHRRGRRSAGHGGLSGPLRAAPIEPAQALPANETLKTIHSLRTIHGNFSDKAVPDDTIRLIIGASVRAANASAYQSYSIVVVKDAATIGS